MPSETTRAPSARDRSARPARGDRVRWARSPARSSKAARLAGTIRLVIAASSQPHSCAALFVWRESGARAADAAAVAVRHRLFALTVAGRPARQHRDLRPDLRAQPVFPEDQRAVGVWTGLAFVPMMGAVLPVNLLAPRLAERIGAVPRPSSSAPASRRSAVSACSGSRPARAIGRSLRR